MFEGRTGFRGLGVKREEKTGRDFIFLHETLSELGGTP